MSTTDHPLRFHLSLNVERDSFESMIAFYTTLFGVPPVKRKADYAKFEPTEPYVNFTFNAVDHVAHGEVDHLGIQVFSDATLASTRNRVVAAGLAVRDEQEVECCYAGQNKFWVTDPTGRQVEFFHVLRNVEQHGRVEPKARETAAGACCAPAITKGNAACCTPEQKAEQGPTTGCC